MSSDDAAKLLEKLCETEAILKQIPIATGYTSEGEIVTSYRPAPLFPNSKD